MRKLMKVTLTMLFLLLVLAGCGKKENVKQVGNIRQEDETEKGDTEEEVKEETPVSTEATAELMKEAYMSFIRGEINMTVKNGDIVWLEKGKEYSYEQMSDAIAKNMADEFGYTEKFDISDAGYAFIDCGADGIPEFILSQSFTDRTNMLTFYSTFKYMDGSVYCIDSRCEYYRSYVDINEYGYISNGGSGGASTYYNEYSYIDKEGNVIYLYSEQTEMGFSDAYIPYYYLQLDTPPEEYPEELYDFASDGITCIIYNFDKYDYEADPDATEYQKKNFYTFCDVNEEYYEPSGELKALYEKCNAKYYAYDEAHDMVKRHEEDLGVTDQIRDGKDIEWTPLLAEGIGTYSKYFTGYDAIMAAVPGKWRAQKEYLAEGIKEAYLQVEETGEFQLDVKYDDEYTAPVTVKGHLLFMDGNSYYYDTLKFYITYSNTDEAPADGFFGEYNMDRYIVNKDQVTMTLSSENIDYFADCFLEYQIVLQKAYQQEEKDTYRIVYNPSEEYICYQEDKRAKDVKPAELIETSCVENEIIDEDLWFDKVGMQGYSYEYEDDNYIYRLGGIETYGRVTMLYVYDKDTKKLLHTYDFHGFIWAYGYENNEFVDRSIRYALIKDGLLYVNLYHNTYAESCPYNAYIMAIDLEGGDVVWKSEPLISNSNNFVIIGDSIVTGYGFTQEDHYLSIINRFDGKEMKRYTIKKSPEYFCYKDNTLYVRTYSYDYEFEVR